MKHLLLTTIAAVVLVGCGDAQHSAPAPESKPVEPIVEVPAQPSSPPLEAIPNEAVNKASRQKPLTSKTLLRAAKKGNIKVVKQHLNAGIYVDSQDKDGWTPLRYAAQFGKKKLAELLIFNEANVNTIDKEGITPLHKAAMLNHWEIIELLITNGADVNAVVSSGIFKGETPLDRSYDATADLLRKHGGKTGEELEAEGK